jgi:hypothetical protein
MLDNVDALEEIVFAEDKRAVLKTLSPSLPLAKYLSALCDLNDPAPTDALLSDSLRRHLQDFGYADEHTRELQLRFFLKRLALAKDEKATAEILREYNDQFFKCVFEHAQPEAAHLAAASDAQAATKSELSAEDRKQLDLSHWLSIAYKDKSVSLLNQIAPKYRTQVDLKNFPLPQYKDAVLGFLNQTALHESQSAVDVFPQLVKYIGAEEAKNLFARFSISQRDKLIQSPEVLNNSQIVVQYIQDKFGAEEQVMIPMIYMPSEIKELEQFAEKLQKIIKFCDTLPKKYERIRSSFLFTLLAVKQSLGVYDQDLLIEYLKSPAQIPANSNTAHEQQVQSQWNAHKAEDLAFNINGGDFSIEDYLHNVLGKSTDYKKFLPYFEERYLQERFAVARLDHGVEVEDLRAVVQPDALASQFSSKRISFVNKQTQFKLGEKVSLKVNLKNIPKLLIKVYEINTLSCLLNGAQGQLCDYGSMELSGVVAKEEYLYSYTQLPYVVHSESFSFASINDKNRGVYIIDFLGDELKSRAVIQVGSLSLVNDDLLGRRVNIIDENGSILTEKGTGIYIKQRFFEANPQGTIQLPANLQFTEGQVILVNSGYAERAFLNLSRENFTLAVSLLYNAEEFTPGKKATIVVRPVLRDQSRTFSNDEIKDAEITVSLRDSDGVEQKTTEKRAALSDAKDVELSLLLPAKLASIRVEVKGKVFDRCKVNGSNELQFAQTRSDSLVSCYHRQSKDGHTIQVLGPAGEPIPRKELLIGLSLDSISTGITVRLTTNEQGKILLGALDHVDSIVVRTNDVKLAEFRLGLSSPTTLPERMSFVTGGKLRFDALPQDKISLWMTTKSWVYETDLTSKLARNGTEVTFTFDKPGYYKLEVNSTQVKIFVLEGTVVDVMGHKIKGKLGLSESAEHSIPLFVDVKESPLEIAVQSSRHSIGQHAHILLYNYSSLSQPLRESLESSISSQNRKVPREFGYSSPVTFYAEGQRISDEEVYIQKRKTKAKFIGNSLEKPTLLMKRNKIGETNEGEHNLLGAMGAGYPTHPTTSCCPPMPPLGCPPPRPRAQIQRPAFLEHPGRTIANVPFIDNHLNITRQSLRGYSYALIYVFDGVEWVSKELLLEETPVLTKDVTLKSAKSAGQVYVSNRSLGYIPQGQTATIKSIGASQFTFIPDLSSLFDSVSLLNKNNTGLQEWKFITEWNSLTIQQKHEKYKTYASHELNVFCFFKDRAFFDTCINNFLQSKVEKTLIDFVLLGMTEKLKRFCHIDTFTKLNKIELLLLAFGLRTADPEFAQTIKNFLRDKSALHILTEEQEKAAFETLLQSKTQETGGPVNFGQARYMDTRMDEPLVEAAKPVKMEVMKKAKMMARSRAMMMACAEVEECENISDMKESASESQPALFSMPEKTVEYIERQYFFKQVGTTIEKFWSDACNHLLEKGSNTHLFSKHFLHACSQNADCIFLLALTDLSTGQKHEETYTVAESTDGLLIKAQVDLILVVKDILETTGQKEGQDILVTQRFFDPADRYVFSEDGSKIDKFLEEFVVGKVYGCQVIVTNTTSNTLDVDLAYEIPQGSIPIGDSESFKLAGQTLAPYSIISKSFNFYFPYTGVFSIYPATAMKKGKILGSAVMSPITVNRTFRETKSDTIADVLASGNTKAIIDFVQNKNIFSPDIFQFDKVYWLLRDKEFYTEFIAALKRRGLFDETAYSFSILHGDLPTFVELVKEKQFGELLHIDSPFLQKDEFEFIDFHPLINARAHSVQQTRANILNKEFSQIYARFLFYLVQKGTMSNEDLVVLTTYLIMQDRNEEAVRFFNKISPVALDSKLFIQFDYLSAYIDFLNGYPNFTTARALCAKHASCPILTWRARFKEIADQLSEFDTNQAAPSDPAKQLTENVKKSGQSVSIKCTLEKDRIKVVSTNVSQLRIKYYKTDSELLFSLNPFKSASSSSLSWVAPFLEQTVAVSSDGLIGEAATTMVVIPPAVQKESLYIEVTHAQPGYARPVFVEYSRFDLEYNLKADFGVVQVIDPATKRGQAKVYVKCFAQMNNGKVQFYKDGYTDLRGMFDYVSLNTDVIENVSKLALLLASETAGSTVVTVGPPSKLGRDVNKDD